MSMWKGRKRKKPRQGWTAATKICCPWQPIQKTDGNHQPAVEGWEWHLGFFSKKDNKQPPEEIGKGVAWKGSVPSCGSGSKSRLRLSPASSDRRKEVERTQEANFWRAKGRGIYGDKSKGPATSCNLTRREISGDWAMIWWPMLVQGLGLGTYLTKN